MCPAGVDGGVDRLRVEMVPDRVKYQREHAKPDCSPHAAYTLPARDGIFVHGRVFRELVFVHGQHEMPKLSMAEATSIYPTSQDACLPAGGGISEKHAMESRQKQDHVVACLMIEG